MYRRDTLFALAGALGFAVLGTRSASAHAETQGLLAAATLRRRLAVALRSTGNPHCLAVATRLEAFRPLRNADGEDIQLHLRSANLDGADLERIANALRSLTDAQASRLTSLSVSYNEGIGDAGATALARALPVSLLELGVVGCRLSDAGGGGLLAWARQATGLRMMCVEGNLFSSEMRRQFRGLAQSRPGLSVYA